MLANGKTMTPAKRGHLGIAPFGAALTPPALVTCRVS